MKMLRKIINDFYSQENAYDIASICNCDQILIAYANVDAIFIKAIK